MFLSCSEQQSGLEISLNPSGSPNPRIAVQRTAQETLQSLIEAQERELGSIARELHDDVCQRLALLSVKIERVATSWAKGQTTIGEQLEQIWRECSDLAGHVQALSHELHPSLLDNIGLVAAIKSLCRELSEQSGAVIQFTQNNVPDDLSREVSLALFRVVQEALHNSMKYSHADDCHVHLQGGRNQIELEIRDSGVGFEVASATRGGLGLTSMRERIHLVDGQITIESRKNNGTRIRASVPLALCKTISIIPNSRSAQKWHA